jgi:peptidoglycan hydrolase CwlO-like protein
MKIMIFFILFSLHAFSQSDYGLTAEDQKYFKNDNFEGKNKLERIDANVKEINKLHQEISELKKEVNLLKEQMKSLRKSDEKK